MKVVNYIQAVKQTIEQNKHFYFVDDYRVIKLYSVHNNFDTKKGKMYPIAFCFVDCKSEKDKKYFCLKGKNIYTTKKEAELELYSKIASKIFGKTEEE